MSTSRFWKLGADSIIIVDAVRVIEETYGLKIAIRQFFEELTTLEALATYIDQHLAPAWTVEESPLPADGGLQGAAALEMPSPQRLQAPASSVPRAVPAVLTMPGPLPREG